MTLEKLLDLYDEVDCVVWINEFEPSEQDRIYKGTVENIIEKYPFLKDKEVKCFHYSEADKFMEGGLDIKVDMD